MDGCRFDRISRVFAVAATRRQGLAAAAGVLAGGLASGAAANHGRGPAHERGGGRKPPAQQGPCGDGSGRANACKRNSECCTGVCRKPVGGRKGHCRCVRLGLACLADRNCCNAMTCVNNVCAPPRPPVCSFRTCAAGCCEDGVCAPGTAIGACGIGGSACAACPQGLSLCCNHACGLGQWGTQTTFTSGSIAAPGGVAVSTDRLTVLLSDMTGSIVTVWTRTTATGTDWSQQTTFGSGTLNTPYGVALTSDGLTAVVGDFGNNRISVWTRTNATGTDWSAQTSFGDSGPAPSQLQAPAGVALSSDGLTIFIADSGNNRISVWTRTSIGSADWNAQTTFGAAGSGPGQLLGPMSVSVTADGLTAMVADSANNRASVWTRPDAASTAWTHQTDFASGTLNTPFGIAITADGMTTLIADSLHNRLASWGRTSSSSADWGDTSSQSGIATGSYSLPDAIALTTDGAMALIADAGNARIAAITLTCA